VQLAGLLRTGLVDGDKGKDVQKLAHKRIGVEGRVGIFQEDDGADVVANVALLLELRDVRERNQSKEERERSLSYVLHVVRKVREEGSDVEHQLDASVPRVVAVRAGGVVADVQPAAKVAPALQGDLGGEPVQKVGELITHISDLVLVDVVLLQLAALDVCGGTEISLLLQR
jgi:hypothetical protein